MTRLGSYSCSTLRRFCDLWMFRKHVFTSLFAAFTLLSLVVPTQARQTTDELNSVAENCLQTVTIVGGYQTFRGAVFQGVLDDGVHISNGDIDVFLRLRTRENRRHSDACSFEAEDVTEREFGLHAVFVTQVGEDLGLSRIRPVTGTNFTFDGCFEDEVKGPTNLKIRTVYRKKSNVIHFRVESSSGGFSSCGN